MVFKSLLYFTRHGLKQKLIATETGEQGDAITQDSYEHLKALGTKVAPVIASRSANVLILHSPFERTKQSARAIADGLKEGGVKRIRLIGNPVGDIKFDKAAYERLVASAGDKPAIVKASKRERTRWLQTNEPEIFKETTEDIEHRAGPWLAKAISVALRRAQREKGLTVISVNHVPNTDLLHYKLRQAAGLPWSEELGLEEEQGFWTGIDKKGDFYLFHNGLNKKPKKVFSKSELEENLRTLNKH